MRASERTRTKGTWEQRDRKANVVKERKGVQGKERGRLGKERNKRKVDSREMLCVGGGYTNQKNSG